MTFEVVRTPSATHGFGAYAPLVDVTINGAGATFPAPLYNAWSQEYGQQRKVAINYQANLTAWGAAACMRLWRITDRDVYRDQSYVYLASFFIKGEAKAVKA